MHRLLSVKPILLTGIASLAIGCVSCSTAPIATGCSELARSVLTTPTPHAALNDSGDPALDWQLYGVAETGQVNRANDDKITGFAIINACEVRDSVIKRQIERPWWRKLWPG